MTTAMINDTHCADCGHLPDEHDDTAEAPCTVDGCDCETLHYLCEHVYEEPTIHPECLRFGYIQDGRCCGHAPDAHCLDCDVPVWEHGGHWLDDSDNHHDRHEIGPPEED